MLGALAWNFDVATVHCLLNGEQTWSTLQHAPTAWVPIRTRQSHGLPNQNTLVHITKQSTSDRCYRTRKIYIDAVKFLHTVSLQQECSLAVGGNAETYRLCPGR
jgi:hypothetical protein